MILPQAQYGHQFELQWVRKSHVMHMLSFLLPHPLATEMFQNGEERMTNTTLSLQPFSALSQESPGMLWAPLLDLHITSAQCRTVPGRDHGVHVEVVRYCPQPVSLAVNHIVPLAVHFKIMYF